MLEYINIMETIHQTRTGGCGSDLETTCRSLYISQSLERHLPGGLLRVPYMLSGLKQVQIPPRQNHH